MNGAMQISNQQLAFARVQAQAAATAGTQLMRRAHAQAGVFQLGAAMQAYAEELQQAAKQNFAVTPGPGMFTELLEKFQSQGLGSAELEELALLERDGQSWLRNLQQWNASLMSLWGAKRASSFLAETSLESTNGKGEDTDAEKERPDNAGVITLIDVESMEANALSFSDALFEEAIKGAAELFERQRANSVEW